MRKVYLDHSATTPVEPRVLEQMLPYFSARFGNASSVHGYGQEALAAVDSARAEVAQALGAAAGEIIFNSGATEGNNTVIKAIARKVHGQDPKRDTIVITNIEHHCVFDSANSMQDEGFKIKLLKVNGEGIVAGSEARKSIDSHTALVSIMHANNEIGTIQPVAEITQVAHAAGALMHTDAVQSFPYIDCDVNELGIDYLTLSAHKFYGPKGVGVLYARRGASYRPYLHGGAQEERRRAGTLNVPGIVGLGAAAQIVAAERGRYAPKLKELRDYFWEQLQNRLGDKVCLNGSASQRLPHNLNVSFQSVEGESMLLGLDLEGIAASTGSACSSQSLEPSHVISAITADVIRSHGSIRFTLGKSNTREEIDYTLAVIAKLYERLSKMSSLKQSNVQ